MASHVHMFVSASLQESTTPARSERRRAPRFRTQVTVEVRGRLLHRTATLDVSRHGLLVAGDSGQRLGTAVSIVAHLPDGPMRAMAVPVRQVKDDDGTVLATALVLFGVGTDLRRRWERFVSGVAGLPGSPGLMQRPWEYAMVSSRLGGAALERIEIVSGDDEDTFDPDVH